MTDPALSTDVPLSWRDAAETVCRTRGWRIDSFTHGHDEVRGMLGWMWREAFPTRRRQNKPGEMNPDPNVLLNCHIGLWVDADSLRNDRAVLCVHNRTWRVHSRVSSAELVSLVFSPNDVAELTAQYPNEMKELLT